MVIEYKGPPNSIENQVTHTAVNKWQEEFYVENFQLNGIKNHDLSL